MLDVKNLSKKYPLEMTLACGGNLTLCELSPILRGGSAHAAGRFRG
ncbi:MAG: hypothetical protein U1B84_27150 [Variovorax sp.]|nr:hypothetical protein [Variovorax sp.]